MGYSDKAIALRKAAVIVDGKDFKTSNELNKMARAEEGDKKGWFIWVNVTDECDFSPVVYDDGADKPHYRFRGLAVSHKGMVVGVSGADGWTVPTDATNAGYRVKADGLLFKVQLRRK